MLGLLTPVSEWSYGYTSECVYHKIAGECVYMNNVVVLPTAASKPVQQPKEPVNSLGYTLDRLRIEYKRMMRKRP